MWDYKLNGNIETQLLDVDFGVVENGKTCVKIVKFVNKTDTEQLYEVQRDPLTNPIDDVFIMKEYSWFLDSGCEYTCFMIYQPRVPFCKNTDYFTIVDSDGNQCFKIIAKGVCMGPKIVFSKTKLIFYSDKKKELKKQIKIKNISKVRAIFQFDFDEEQCPFKLTPTCGTVEPSSFIYITIVFVPPSLGIYANHLPCLLLNHRPIIIELYGYCGLEYSSEIEFQQSVLFSTLSKLEGYENYMSDVSNIRRNCPPLMSLSSNYIDFGQASIGYENFTRRPPQTICFHNHSSTNFLLIWEKTSNVFKINPPTAEVKDKNSSIFEISFNPLEENVFYCQEILLQVFGIGKKVSIPMTLSLRIIGHSFREGLKRPIPYYKIPQTVLMPTCCPTYPVYTTFLIRKLEDQYPLMFHFVPPEVTNFTIKPMLGIIYKDYQIVTVEMFPDTEGEHLYYERWSIRFNDCRKSEDYIDFKGYTEYLNLKFEVDNCISFEPTFPGCCQLHQVSVRNVTRHCIKYSFLHLPEEIKIQQDQDIVNPNESILQQWIFCPSEIGNYNFTVKCKLNAVDVETMEIKDSPNKIIEIDVSGISEKGTLIATPNELNVDELAVGNSKSLSFKLFNFSRVVIHFKLSSTHKSWPIGCLERDLNISPKTGTILPRESKRINVKLTPHENGFYEFFVQYLVRPDSDSENLVLNDEAKNICLINCSSLYPTFIVKDLLYFGTGSGVSKVSLWKLMKINKLNKILHDLKPNSNLMLEMTFPVFTFHEEPLRIEFLIKNPMTIPVSWSLKRVKLCSCEKKLKSQSLSFQSIAYDCVHREVCKFYPKSGTIKSRGEERLSLEVRYHLVGLTELQWELILTENRRVTLRINLRCVSEEIDELIFFQEPPLQFDKVHIGDLNPIHQMCWIYNSMQREISYSLDTDILNKINEKFGGEIFTCVNPEGSLKGMSHQPIIFKYHPRQFQEYLIKIPLMLGKKETELIIKGESSRNPITKVVERISPYQDKFLIPEVPIYFNTDSLTISPLSTQSTVTRMIMVHNRHPQDMLAYSWDSYEVPQIIKASIHPSKGRIQPLKMQTFLLTVIAGSRPSKITICLSCKFINVSERRLYEKELLSSFYTLKQLENYFTITEKGIFYPKDAQRIPTNLKPTVPFYKGLTIRAYIYSTEDYEMKATLKQQLKLSPLEEIALHNVKRKKNIVSEDNLKICGFILECMIWDILNSRDFQHLLKEVTLNSTDIKYSQMVMNEGKRKELIRKSYIKPPKSMIETMLQKMIFTIVHEEYMLDTNHLVEPTDVRQLTYTKISAGVRKNHKSRSSNCSL